MSESAPSLACLARLAVAVVTHQPEELRRFAADAGPEHRGSPALRETLLQAHVFCGFPRTLACLDVLGAAGFTLEGAVEGEEPSAEDLRLRGAGLFDAIYGVEHANFQPKPDRAAYDIVFGLDGLTPGAAAMFEDDPRNLSAPHAMGMRTVHVAPEVFAGEHIHHHTMDLTAFLGHLR